MTGARAEEPAGGQDPELAMKALLKGNQQFATGKIRLQNLGSKRRGELNKGQHPYAVVVSCSDSRVPPEHVFNAGLGDLFVVRVAGNIVDSLELGSVEYAAEHLGARLIVVLGHTSCGAVKATVDGGAVEGNIKSVVDRLSPVVEQTRKTVTDPALLVDAAVRDNVIRVMSLMTAQSGELRHMAELNKIKIVGMVYNLATGKVVVVNAPQAAPTEEKKH